MRTKNSIRNVIVGLIGELVTTLLSFLSRTVFIYSLGANYLGINGLFTNILSILSLAELGVGSAIIYNMYKPLAQNDIPKIKSLMKLYAKAYNLIGVVVGVSGLLLTPFLDYIIKDKPDIPNLTIIYLMFLLNSVVSYFFVYKSALIIANQKNYVVILKTQKFTFVQTIVQIIILLITKNYILYLFIQIIYSFTLNLSISRKANQLYPFLKDKSVEDLDWKSKKQIFKHVSAMMSHKVGGVIVNGTDNMLISTFVGVFWVGLYSNYILIIGMVNKFIRQIFTAITASIGNLNTEKNKQKSYDIYKKILFVNFWLSGFSTICLSVLFNPFIELWAGKEYLLSNEVVIVIIINFYIMGMRQATITFNTTLGLFWNDRYKPWIEAFINLVASIFLLNKLGMIGVFLGTLTSTVLTSLWVDPYILFKNGFNKKLSKYFKSYIKYLLQTVISGIITVFITLVFNDKTWIAFIYKLVICAIVPNVLFFIFNFRNQEFRYFEKLVTNFIGRNSNKSSE